MAEETNTPELVLEEVVELEADALSDEQKTFLEENKATLTPEQAEKFGIEVEKKPDEELKPEDVEVETRGGEPAAPKKKEGEEEEDEIEPEDEKVISRVVEKKLQEAGVSAAKDQIEVDAFLRVRPEYGKYRQVILNHMKHPAYSRIPVHNIAAIVSAKDQQKLGAEKEREAAKKAKETQGGGSQTRSHTGKVDWHNAPLADFEAQRAKVLGQGV